MGKKVIVFDLDETLRSLEKKPGSDFVKVRLRPNIKTLLEKLKEVKDKGIDIMIYTDAYRESAQKYFIDYLPEEYRDLFCRIISGDNRVEIERGSIEERVYGLSRRKAVTSIKGYDQILFFDDVSQEGYFLGEIYENKEKSPNKQVIFASYQYDAPESCNLYAYRMVSKENAEVAKKVDMLFRKLLQEPGCALMIEKIDEFQQIEFSKGLTLDTKNKGFYDFNMELFELEEEVKKLINRDSELSRKFEGYKEEYSSLSDNEKIKIDGEFR